MDFQQQNQPETPTEQTPEPNRRTPEVPAGNQASSPYQHNPYDNNNYPYYNRGSYQLPVQEPGSSLAKAAMVLGIAAIASCFTFTVYPPFVLGAIAIVLALLSKGRRPKQFPNARTGIICAASAIALDIVIIVGVMYLVLTKPFIRGAVNQAFKQQYGITFDEAIEEIMERNNTSD